MITFERLFDAETDRTGYSLRVGRIFWLKRVFAGHKRINIIRLWRWKYGVSYEALPL